MFRLEKIFQNDDLTFLNFFLILKSLSIYLVIYIFSILKDNSIYDLIDFEIYIDSVYFNFSIFFTIVFFFNEIFFYKKKKHFIDNLKNDLKKDFINYLFSVLIVLISTFFIFQESIYNEQLLYLFIILSFNIFLINFFKSKVYLFLVDKNIIQKNIMLVGNYESISKIIKEKKNNINVYKCCIIFDKNENNMKEIRNEIRIPIFTINNDIRSILEYHALGQIWILDNKITNVHNMLNYVLKFSVDILIVDLSEEVEQDPSLINFKYRFSYYEKSRFHGSKLLIKIFLDKILSLFFLILLSPIIILTFIGIYLEDGFPLIFTQDRTGWDGRRFKIFKIRSLKNTKFDKTNQVQLNDDRLLKIGKLIRKFSIDEVPQFINVLIGEMSIVGPRPHMVEHDIYYSNFFKEFLKRHKTSPGLTGWAQINGLRGATPTPEVMKKRMELDLWYLNNWTPFLDILIIIKTFYIIFKYKGT